MELITPVFRIVGAFHDEIIVHRDADAAFGNLGGCRGDVVDEGVVEGAEVDVGGFGGLLLFHVVCCFLLLIILLDLSDLSDLWDLSD